ncbi:uncharacterized protein LOC130808238 [Amaranthus tricolor]|uniref:uncharacterized protein LOC130808238 n=1 Tax=Amaranthus tricolor TaxID=29722 RepID=UPI002582D44D|nr:uncharacterized protein LOC130808238 [Amaranthus tricolor]
MRQVNVTWVTLIPKSENPMTIEDYRPISMVGALYKIITKILSLRLREVIAPLIDESQSAFVMNRQILDGVLIAINWNFLQLVMEKLGFGRTWIRWIMNCDTSASMSILLNGTPLKSFKMEREAIQVGKDQVCLKHLQFADDMLIFAPKNMLCINNYLRILDVFAMMSGLSLNYSKSCFISWSSRDQQWAREVASSMGCRHSSCPVTYLGFPLGDNMNKRSAWKPVIDKIQCRLATWKAKILSRAGRLTLIKSVLNSLPVYYMSMFKMPKAIASKIVSIQRSFFWGGLSENRKGCNRVKWTDIQLPKQMGGLGVGNIMHKNLMLLFKWWWRFSDSNNAMWKKILKSVHEIKGLKASSEAFTKVREGAWALLLSNDADTARIRSVIEEGMIVKLGNGSSTQFWHDTWCEAGPLKRIFPRLFSISMQKTSFISQMGVWQEDIWSWQFRWRRTLYDWEDDEVLRLRSQIEHKRPIREVEDGVLWRHSGNSCDPIKSITQRMNEEFASTLPKPVLIFLGKLSTGDFLVDKGIIEPHRALCPFCNQQTESNSHVLFTCGFSWRVWMHMLEWWGLSDFEIISVFIQSTPGMLLSPGSTSYPTLVKVFYSNLSFIMVDGEQALRSFVKEEVDCSGPISLSNEILPPLVEEEVVDGDAVVPKEAEAKEKEEDAEKKGDDDQEVAVEGQTIDVNSAETTPIQTINPTDDEMF